MGLLVSVEVEASDTVSPTCGSAGNHTKDAVGCAAASQTGAAMSVANANAARARALRSCMRSIIARRRAHWRRSAPAAVRFTETAFKLSGRASDGLNAPRVQA